MKSLALSAAALVLCGCTSTSTPYYDAHFGDAVRQARMAMTLNPLASATAGAPGGGGIEGKTAAEAAARYLDTYKSPPPVVNVINIGGGVGGGNR